MKKIAVPTLVFIFIFGVLFFLTSAVSVQSGDTGELVTNSYFLRVSHAPGYPLWTLLYHLPVKYLGGGNPFQAASLFTVGITLAWMGGLLWLFKGWESFLIVAVLATNITVWRYAVLPDVFSLHLLFLFLVSIVFHRPAAIKNPLLLFLISLSVSHHHTIVFAFPLFLYAFHRERSLRLFGLSLLFGILSFSIYLSLLAFHPQDYGSFGDLRSILDVVNHFLRKDYGTLKLMAREDAGSSSWGLFFLETFIKDSWSILVAILYVTFRHGPQLKSLRPKLAILGLSLVLYILVFSVMGKISLSVGSEGVFERFLLQPTFLVFLLALMVFSSEGVKLPRWLLLLFVVNTGVNSVTNYKLADYRSNTFIEDYLLNGLNSLPKNSVLYTYGDNIGFGMYYVKDVRKVRPDVTHIHPSFGFDWGVEKTIRKYPDLFIDQKKGFPEGFNFEKYRFFTNLQIDSLPKGYQVSYAGLFF